MGDRLGWNTEQVIASRYARKDSQGKATETWPDIAKRIAYHIGRDQKQRGEFQEMLLQRTFLPNTPCIVNAGRENGQLAACFIVDVPDSLDGILDAVKAIGMIQKTGGGTGMDGSKLRPMNARIASTGGKSSGPVSFFSTIFNSLTEAIKQGGVRRGANMLTLSVHHPDILEFICAKHDQTTLTNFNISVTVTDDFMKAVKGNKYYALKFKGKHWNGEVPLGKTAPGAIPIQRDQEGNVLLYAPAVWNLILSSAHQYAEPGVIFIDTINKYNLLKGKYGDIATTNPCSEYAAHNWNSCNLGSIDVSKFYNKHLKESGYIDWEALIYTVSRAVDFLDNVIDKSVWPLPQIKAMVQDTRPIGLGVMGVADLLIKLKIKYGSPEAIKVVQEILKKIQQTAWTRSIHLARQYGSCPAAIYNERVNNAFRSYLNTRLTPGQMENYYTPRNYQVTTIAPTGSISLIAETSSGIEPNFAWVTNRSDSIGKRTYPHALAAEALGITWNNQDPDDIDRAARDVVERQDELPDYFITAHDLTALEHAKFLAACQVYVDNGISKTCNGGGNDTTEDVKNLYEYCYDAEVRSVSYYRDGSRDNQVLTKVEKKSTLKERVESGQRLVSKPVLTEQGWVTELKTELAQYPTMADDQGATQKPVLTATAVRIAAENKARITTEVVDLTRGDEPLIGKTYRFRTNPKLYVTINVNQKGRIIEVFVKGGEVSESMGMMMSLLLREGFPVEKLINRLRTVHGQYAIYFNQRCCTSPEQMIAEALEVEVARLKREQVEFMAQFVKEPESSKELLAAATQARVDMVAMMGAFSEPVPSPSLKIKGPCCPNCSAVLTFTEGCRKCLQCGYEKCG